MKHTMWLAKSVLAMGIAAAIPAHADTSDLSVHTEKIVAEAKKVQSEARGISAALKVSKPDFEQVKGMFAKLETHVGEVDKMVLELEPQSSSFSPAQKQNYELMKSKAQLLNIFTQNKKALLEGTEPRKNKTLIRAKADGIAKRAELLQATTLKLKQ